MSSDDQWSEDDNQEESRDKRDFGDEQQDWTDDRFDAQRKEPKPGMSTGMKVLIILLCVGGLGFLLCCGGIFYFASKVDMEFNDDPTVIRKVTAEIVDIEIPDLFEPKASVSMNVFVVEMKMVVYGAKDEKGILMITEMDTPTAEGNEQQQAQMRKSMQQQNFGEKNLTTKRSESREFEVRGETVKFQFAEAEDEASGTAYRQVTGAFPGKEGNTFLMLQIEEEQYDEEAVVKMLESIK
jgi:hypothetical protein